MLREGIGQLKAADWCECSWMGHSLPIGSEQQKQYRTLWQLVELFDSTVLISHQLQR